MPAYWVRLKNVTVVFFSTISLFRFLVGRVAGCRGRRPVDKDRPPSRALLCRLVLCSRRSLCAALLIWGSQTLLTSWGGRWRGAAFELACAPRTWPGQVCVAPRMRLLQTMPLAMFNGRRSLRRERP